jgi:beta-galactosidase
MPKMNSKNIWILALFVYLLTAETSFAQSVKSGRERISINQGWRFFKYESAEKADKLIYDVRPEVTDITENKVADAKPTEAVETAAKQEVLKAWILPSGNAFIYDPSKRHIRPDGNPGGDFPFVQNNFDDKVWEKVDLPHDWAIKGPFQLGPNPEVGGGMGRLPVNGVAWYRRKLDIPVSDAGKSIFLDFDGAMSYAIVWLNGKLVGGWPYGYNSFQLDLTPYVNPGGENQLAICIDNPNYSARWYPGAGLYRNVWLTKTSPVHLAQYGTCITTKDISKESATVQLTVSVENDSKKDALIEVSTQVYGLDSKGNKSGKSVGRFSTQSSKVVSSGSKKLGGSLSIKNPKLWGPPPTQTPNLYLAETTISENGKIIDTYQTRFGIRSLEFNPDKGIFVNGEHIQIKGVNQHHDLGALGAAFNTRAAERQLEILREMGCNAIRFAHNPPAPELLELTDRMGFLVIDEIFDSWERKKTPHDFHLIFPDWSEPDTRAFVRRDRNCPSVIIWSFGNEVGEQYTAEEGAKIGKRLHEMIRQEDLTRPTICAMNYAKPDMELPKVPDVIGLNYQGEGIRQAPEFEGTDRIRTVPQYDAFHAKFPDKVILSTETASAFSSRGIYLFPVSKEISAPVRDGRGGDSKICQVSSYELHAVDFGSSVDKVFGSLEQHQFVAGEFVWNGFDYIGEPTPYYEARSSYSGIIDLAGFPKDRFYLYQSHWRPDLPMVHILPHWNWQERIGQITPVHVFTSGDEAELFLKGKSQGKKKKGEYEYRLRWDEVVYEPGELKVVAYKNGRKWAEEVVKTTDEASALKVSADRNVILADGKDLSFVTVKIIDKNELVVPRSNNRIEFSIEGPGEIVATDNGDSYNLESFASHQRNAFNGLALVIVRAKAGEKGTITVSAKSAGLKEARIKLQSK